MNPPLENSAESSVLRSEIDQTRQRMDQTIDALGERLKGRHLVDEALHFFRTQTQNGNMNQFKDTLTRSANSAARSVVDAVKTNPVPLVLIGAGVGLYLYNRAQSRIAEWELRPEDYRDYRYQDTAETEFGGGFDEAKSAPQRVGERLQQAGEQVRTRARDVAEGARELGAQAVERSRQLYREGRQRAVSAVDKHPLETGLLCLALGLLAGVALPTSEKVRRRVAPQAHALRDRTRAVVAGGRQVIRSAAEAARQEARNQGLTMDSLKARGSAVGQTATDAAEGTARDEGLMPAGVTPAGGV